MKTISECLLRLKKEEMRCLSLRLSFGPVPVSAKKAEIAARIEKNIQDDPKCIRLLLRLEEADAICRTMEAGTDIEEALAKEEYLLDGLLTLKECCLAYKTTDGWCIQPCVKDAVTLEENDRKEQEVYDLIADLVEGLLIHVGMMPLDSLLDRLISLLKVDPEGVADVRQAIVCVMIARMGPQCIFSDDHNRPWVVYEALDDPDLLLCRLEEPHIASLSYPDFTVEQLILAAWETRVPGEKELYQPMVEWLSKHGADDETIGDALEEYVLLCQNGECNAALEAVMMMVPVRDLKDAQQLADASCKVANGIPLWDNKGHSAKELFNAKSAPKRSSPVPGRNDPCPCGSGKKYKQCCGSRLH